MKTLFLSLTLSLMALSASADEVMTKKSDGTYIVNTTTLCQARGFKGTTPLEVHIKKGKIVKIVPLKNKETPSYFKKVKDSLEKQYVGMKVSKLTGKGPQVDAVTGATFSSKAVNQNVKAAAKYYSEHK